MKAGIVIDDWKLPVFRRRLTKAGFTYSDAGGLTVNTTLLTVHTDDVDALRKVLEDSADECNRNKKR